MECIREPAGRLKQLEDIFGKKVWRVCDQFVADKGVDVPDWPDWCALPISAGMAVATYGDSGAGLCGAMYAASIAGLYAWRTQKVILDFDVDLARAVFDSDLADELPCQALLHLPFHCPYIHLSEEVRSELALRVSSTYAAEVLGQIRGFFVFLEWDVKHQYPELRFLLDIEGEGLRNQIIHLNHSTLKGALESAVIDTPVANMREQGWDARLLDAYKGVMSMFLPDLGEVLIPLLKLTLYICTSDKDIRSSSSIDFTRRSALKVKRTRKRAIVETARNPLHVQVGYVVGAKLRQQDIGRSGSQSGGRELVDDLGRPPRAHWRRGHFHSYRIGKRKNADGTLIDKSERGLVTRWLPPTPVNVADVDDMSVTMRSVE